MADAQHHLSCTIPGSRQHFHTMHQRLVLPLRLPPPQPAHATYLHQLHGLHCPNNAVHRIDSCPTKLLVGGAHQAEKTGHHGGQPRSHPIAHGLSHRRKGLRITTLGNGITFWGQRLLTTSEFAGASTWLQAAVVRLVHGCCAQRHLPCSRYR